MLPATGVKFNSGLYEFIVQTVTFYDCQEFEIPGFYSLSDFSEQLSTIKQGISICNLGRKNPGDLG